MNELLLSLILIVALAACTSSAEPTPDTATKEGACNGLSNLAKPVTITNVDSAPPPASGGTIADGTYVLAKATVHTGPGGEAGPTSETRVMTIRFEGGAAESVFDGVNRSSSVVVRGTSLHTTGTCPSTNEDDQAFTATASTLSVQSRRNKGTLVLDFVKR